MFSSDEMFSGSHGRDWSNPDGYYSDGLFIKTGGTYDSTTYDSYSMCSTSCGYQNSKYDSADRDRSSSDRDTHGVLRSSNSSGGSISAKKIEAQINQEASAERVALRSLNTKTVPTVAACQKYLTQLDKAITYAQTKQSRGDSHYAKEETLYKSQKVALNARIAELNVLKPKPYVQTRRLGLKPYVPGPKISPAPKLKPFIRKSSLSKSSAQKTAERAAANERAALRVLNVKTIATVDECQKYLAQVDNAIAYYNLNPPRLKPGPIAGLALRNKRLKFEEERKFLNSQKLALNDRIAELNKQAELKKIEDQINREATDERAALRELDVKKVPTVSACIEYLDQLDKAIIYAQTKQARGFSSYKQEEELYNSQIAAIEARITELTAPKSALNLTETSKPTLSNQEKAAAAIVKANEILDKFEARFAEDGLAFARSQAAEHPKYLPSVITVMWEILDDLNETNKELFRITKELTSLDHRYGLVLNAAGLVCCHKNNQWMARDLDKLQVGDAMTPKEIKDVVDKVVGIYNETITLHKKIYRYFGEMLKRVCEKSN